VIVCQCRRTTDRQVLDAIESGAGSLEELRAACGAGSECCGCVPTLEAFLDGFVASNLPRERRLSVLAA
jgi:bacterioferritin-associated ferredoxin